eukprot:3847796-Rhodomonas_salina.2
MQAPHTHTRRGPRTLRIRSTSLLSSPVSTRLCGLSTGGPRVCSLPIGGTQGAGAEAEAGPGLASPGGEMGSGLARPEGERGSGLARVAARATSEPGNDHGVNRGLGGHANWRVCAGYGVERGARGWLLPQNSTPVACWGRTTHRMGSVVLQQYRSPYPYVPFRVLFVQDLANEKAEAFPRPSLHE